MKRIAITALCLFVALAASAQNVITVKGHVSFPVEGEPIRIAYHEGFATIEVDSIYLNPDNTFSKKITLPKTGMFTINCQNVDRGSFWGENEDIEINFRGKDTAGMRIMKPEYRHINNAGPNNELVNLNNFFTILIVENMYAAGALMHQAEQSGSEAFQEAVKDGYVKNNEFRIQLMDHLCLNYIDRNSVMSIMPGASAEVRQKVLDYFEANKPDYAPYVAYKEKAAFNQAQRAKLEPGNVAPDFSFPTPDNSANLGPKDFKGKYILIDFWASWCGPCRASIPHLKEVYERYKDRNFEILSVSIDKKTADWHKALGAETMPWPQVLAPNSGTELLKLYQFSGIPHIVLIGPDGKIVAKDVRVKDIDQLLAEIFD